MIKPALGSKCQCVRCGRRYYDLKKNPPSCPFCEAVFDAEQLWRHRHQPAAFEPGYSDYGDVSDEAATAIDGDELSHELLEVEDDGAVEVLEADSSVDLAKRDVGSE